MRSRVPLLVVTVVLIGLSGVTAWYLAGGGGTHMDVLATVTPYPTSAAVLKGETSVAAVQVTIVSTSTPRPSPTATPDIPWGDTATAYDTNCIVPLWVQPLPGPMEVPIPPLCTPGFVGLNPDTWCRWRLLSLTLWD
jgi:hypothetical protein